MFLIQSRLEKSGYKKSILSLFCPREAIVSNNLLENIVKSAKAQTRRKKKCTVAQEEYEIWLLSQ